MQQLWRYINESCLYFFCDNQSRHMVGSQQQQRTQCKQREKWTDQEWVATSLPNRRVVQRWSCCQKRHDRHPTLCCPPRLHFSASWACFLPNSHETLCAGEPTENAAKDQTYCQTTPLPVMVSVYLQNNNNNNNNNNAELHITIHSKVRFLYARQCQCRL